MAAGLMTLARPLISFLYGGGEFDAFSVDITSQALFWVSIGMVGYALQNILSRGYFAQQDGRTPLIAGAVSILVNIVLCMLLTEPMGVSGLAISSAVSSTVYALLLMIPLERRGEGVLTPAFVVDFGKMLLSAVCMAVVVWLTRNWLGGILPSGKLGELVQLGVCAVEGVAVYFLLVTLLGLEEARLVRDMLRRIVKRG